LQHLATSCNCSASVQQHENSAFVPFKLPETPADKFAILGQLHKKGSQRCFKGPEQNIGFCVSWSLRSLKCEVKIFRSLKWLEGHKVSLPSHYHDTVTTHEESEACQRRNYVPRPVRIKARSEGEWHERHRQRVRCTFCRLHLPWTVVWQNCWDILNITILDIIYPISLPSKTVAKRNW
jgi:hypothetical protein